MVDGFGAIDSSPISETVLRTFDPLEHLSGDERKIASMLQNNIKPTEIANRMNMSKSTVYNRISALKRKLAALAEYKHMETR